MSNCVKGVFTRWGYSPYGYLQAQRYTYFKAVLHTHCMPITEGNLALRGGGGEKAGTYSEYFYLAIPPACGTLYTGLLVTIQGKMVMPIFQFVARQAF